MKKTTMMMLREKYAKATKSPTAEKRAQLLRKIEKSAAGFSAGKVLGGAAILGLAAPGGHLLAGAIRNKYYRMKADETYPKILKKFPDLANYENEDVRENFDVLREIAPHMASIPALAGPWLRRTMAWKDEGLTPEQLQKMVDLEIAQKKIGPGAHQEAVGRGLGSIPGAAKVIMDIE